MMTKIRRSVGGLRALWAGVVLSSTLFLSSCFAAPFLIPVAIEFARNLIQTSLSNYGSKHRDNLSNLVNRLSSPYLHNLPQTAAGMPGMPAQPGVPQQAYPGQQGYPAQQTYLGQTGGYDPNNPSGNSPGYPGATTYPGTGTNPYGAGGGYQSQAQSGYDPNNPYGQTQTNPYGSTAPYGSTGSYGTTNPYGTQTPYGSTNPSGAQSGYGTQPAQPGYGSSGGNSAYGQQSQYGSNPYGTTNPYGTSQQNAYGTANSPYGSQPGYDPNNPYAGTGAASGYGQAQSPYGQQPAYGTANPYGTPQTGQGYGQAQSQYGQQPTYGGTASPYGTPQTGQGYGQAQSQYGQQPAYGGSTNPYGTPQTGQGYGQVQSPYGQQPAYGTPAPYGGAQSGYGTAGQPYGGQYGAAGVSPRGTTQEPVAVDVAMIRQKRTAKGKEVVLMNDGEVLKDGGSQKDAGDRFKLVTRTNCDCYLYVVAIDGSGWAEPVYPPKGKQVANPVKKDQEYAFPEGPYWFTLDQVKGIETFYVVASANRRADLEDSMVQLAAETRPAATIVAKVEEPPVIPRGVGSVQSRGIMTVKDETGSASQVTPLSYAAGQAGQDVTVTRWFKHE